LLLGVARLAAAAVALDGTFAVALLDAVTLLAMAACCTTFGLQMHP
jgi:hypothetical protein